MAADVCSDAIAARPEDRQEQSTAVYSTCYCRGSCNARKGRKWALAIHTPQLRMIPQADAADAADAARRVTERPDIRLYNTTAD